MASPGRILYIQYTNPSAYPALEHSAHILARAGWEVLFVGVETIGSRDLVMRPHENVTHQTIKVRPGSAWGASKLAAYGAGVLKLAREFKPDWCYASDADVAGVALAVRTLNGAKIVYHEHDAPDAAAGFGDRATLFARGLLAKKAEVIVVPNEERRALLPAAGADRATVVWNCPMRDETRATIKPHASDKLRLVFAGSISPKRLPLTILTAIKEMPSVQLDIFGYASVGGRAYLSQLLNSARAQGMSERVTYQGTVPARMDMLSMLGARDIGIATVDPAPGDQNMTTMIGSSNKPFDYMSQGLPFLVSERKEWLSAFVDPGYAIECNQQDPQSIRDAIVSLSDGSVRHRMGEAARTRILADWNYEHQFAPVLARLSAARMR